MEGNNYLDTVNNKIIMDNKICKQDAIWQKSVKFFSTWKTLEDSEIQGSVINILKWQKDVWN